ncbi:MAG: hypothetical protein ACR2J0_07285 [Mycobacteriales bacterium]
MNLVVKTALAALILFVAVRHDLPRFQGKAMPLRLVTYPLAALVVPLWWRFRGGRAPYPHDVDALLVAPFVIDLAGNVLDLFDAVTWWDDANHFVNWALLVGGMGRLLRRTEAPRATAIGLAVGFGAVTAMLWEFGEYLTFVQHSAERFTAYRDTMGDEALGLAGSLVGAVLSTARQPSRAAGNPRASA